MDRITTSLLEEFSKAMGIEGLSEERRFEHFAAYLTTSRFISETFDTLLLPTTRNDEHVVS